MGARLHYPMALHSMRARPLTSFCALAGILLVASAYDISDQERAAIEAVFASVGGGGVTIPGTELRKMVSGVVEKSSNGKFSADMHKKHVNFLMTGYEATGLAKSSEFTLEQFLSSTGQLQLRDANNPPTPPPKPACLDEGGAPLPKHIQKRLGSCQLKQLRAKLERNRLTMPLFDTLRWVRDFERSLEAMWEIYASGHEPMNVVVFPMTPESIGRKDKSVLGSMGSIIQASVV